MMKWLPLPLPLPLPLLLMAACAPMMETQYTYLPPQDPEAQACATLCSATNNACLREAEESAAAARGGCELEARQDYELCLLRVPAGNAQPLCQLRACPVSADFAACDAPFRSCFQECGGFIESRQVCTFNCR